MPITRKLVLQRVARLSVNVFWIAMMIAPVKLRVFSLSKMITLNAHARFVEWSILNGLLIIFYCLKENCQLGCPCDNYDCNMLEKKAILTLYSGNSRSPVLIQPDGKFLNSFILNRFILRWHNC